MMFKGNTVPYRLIKSAQNFFGGGLNRLSQLSLRPGLPLSLELALVFPQGTFTLSASQYGLYRLDKPSLEI